MEAAVSGGAVRQRQAVKVVLAVVLGLVALLGCQFVIGAGVATLMWRHWPTRTPTEVWFEAARIQVEDLPRGWHYVGAEVENVPGADARSFWYYGPPGENMPWVKVVQKIIRYSSSQTAAEAYEQWVDEYIPPAGRDEWIQPPGLEFTGQANQMVVACLSGYVNDMHHYACSAIGRYEDVVVVLIANVFDERWLTTADFQAVLEAMDRRLVAAQESAR